MSEVDKRRGTDIGSSVLVSQGFRWSDVEGSKIMAGWLASMARLDSREVRIIGGG